MTNKKRKKIADLINARLDDYNVNARYLNDKEYSTSEEGFELYEENNTLRKEINLIKEVVEAISPSTVITIMRESDNGKEIGVVINGKEYYNSFLLSLGNIKF